MNKRCLFFLCIFFFLSMMGCEGGLNGKSLPDGTTVTSAPTERVTVRNVPDWIRILNYNSLPTSNRLTFEYFESRRPVEDRLDQSSVFGDAEVQQKAEQLREGLNMTAPTDVIEYAYRLLPLIESSGYFGSSNGGWMLLSLAYYEDGVWSIHYDERAMLPENYEEMTAEERYYFYRGIYDGGMHVNVSSSDGHIISLEGPLNERIEGKEKLPSVDKNTVPDLKCQPFNILEIQDISLKQYFTGWTGEHGQMYSNAPLEVATRFEDNALQEAAAAACADLELDTIEGMSEYAWRLGELLCDTEYQVSDVGYDVSSMTRYTDGSWEIHLQYPKEPLSASSDKNHAYVYVSEADGHIICMFDANGSLIQK